MNLNYYRDSSDILHHRFDIEINHYEGKIMGRSDLAEESKDKMEDPCKEIGEKYYHLFELESDALFLIDNESGNILEANQKHATVSRVNCEFSRVSFAPTGWHYPVTQL